MNEDANTRHPTTVTMLSDTEVRIERLFDAPRELVWDAYTDPELLCQWLGPRRLTMTVQEMDVRAGGSYRYTHQNDADGPFVFYGEFREVDPPRLLVQTFDFERNELGPSIDRVEFEQVGAEQTRSSSARASTRSRRATRCCNPAWRRASRKATRDSTSCLRAVTPPAELFRRIECEHMFPFAQRRPDASIRCL